MSPWKPLLALLAALITGCASRPVSEAVKMPESMTAFIAWHQSKGLMFNSRQFTVIFIDGENSGSQKEDPSVWGGYRLLPGKHLIGVLVHHGSVCLPGPLGDACFNSCISGIALDLEAGRRYGYEIKKNKNEVLVDVVDDTGKVVSRTDCEPCSYAVCGREQINSIMDRVQRKSVE